MFEILILSNLKLPVLGDTGSGVSESKVDISPHFFKSSSKPGTVFTRLLSNLLIETDIFI